MYSSRKRHFSLLAAIAAIIIAISCATSPRTSPPEQSPPTTQEPSSKAPKPVEEPILAAPEPILPKEEPPKPVVEAFDPSTVPEAIKTATIVDVRAFIESLNQIIRHKDYETWLSNLTEDYIVHYSDPSILSQYSNYPIMLRQGIKLLTLKDFFIYVVYPSRQNDKVDDIEFVGENLIKAITVSPKGDRNILYMLEKHGDAWKIGIGRS